MLKLCQLILQLLQLHCLKKHHSVIKCVDFKGNQCIPFPLCIIKAAEATHPSIHSAKYHQTLNSERHEKGTEHSERSVVSEHHKLPPEREGKMLSTQGSNQFASEAHPLNNAAPHTPTNTHTHTHTHTHPFIRFYSAAPRRTRSVWDSAHHEWSIL